MEVWARTWLGIFKAKTSVIRTNVVIVLNNINLDGFLIIKPSTPFGHLQAMGQKSNRQRQGYN